MKTLLQDLKNGETEIETIPRPNCGPNDVLIQTHLSLISPGTERMILNFGKGSYFEKAKQQPEKVKQVIEKVKTDGILPTLNAVKAKLDTPLPLGYSNIGTVIEVGANVTNIKENDLVVSNGNHASVVCVNKNLVAIVPKDVDEKQAVFTVISSIALQGIRVCKPSMGDTIVVIGLGLLGQITLDLLSANGCDPIGFDIDDSKIELAKSRGFKAYNTSVAANIINGYTDNVGADATIITASTSSNQPTELAVELCRQKGQIVAVGAFKMDIPRENFYKKELSFHISMSYGPGRYDKNYEQKGQDYPISYVRWTENRNFQAILNLLDTRKLDFSYLISKEIEFKDLEHAYAEVLNDSSVLGAVINYPHEVREKHSRRVVLSSKNNSKTCGKVSIGMIGAGNFASVTLLPLLKKLKASLIGISSFKGLSATIVGKKFNFSYVTTDYKELLNDKSINTIIISTQHSSHSQLVCEALEAGKHVFVEKPLAVNESQLNNILDCYNNLTEPPLLMVGFNRRFSPLSLYVKSLLEGRLGPICVSIQVNAGFIPYDHWVHESKNGGRFIGEGCHFVDLIHFFTNSYTNSVQSVGKMSGLSHIQNDTVMTQFSCADGSIASIHYLSNGHKSYPKEKITIYWDNKILEIDNWKKVKGYGVSGKNFSSQQKGHKEELISFIDAIENNKCAPIDIESLVKTTTTTFDHLNSLALTDKTLR